MFVLLFLFVSLTDVFGYYLADLSLTPRPLEETGYTYKKCLSMRKILYENQCWDLLTRGPCDKGQWLVLDWSDDGQTKEMKAKCTKRRCSESDVYWPSDGFCYDVENIRRNRLCPFPDTEVATDEFGYGYCECRNSGQVPYVRVVQSEDVNENSMPCYPMYTRGPCPLGHVITPFGWGYGNCTADVCDTGRHRPSVLPLSLSLKSRKQAVQVPWTDGRCYELGSRGPCAGNDQLMIVRDAMKLGCVSPVTVLDLFSNKRPTTTTPPPQPECETDHRGVCVDGIDVQMSDPSFGFEEQLRESAKRHGKRNKRKRMPQLIP